MKSEIKIVFWRRRVILNVNDATAYVYSGDDARTKVQSIGTHFLTDFVDPETGAARTPHQEPSYLDTRFMKKCLSKVLRAADFMADDLNHTGHWEERHDMPIERLPKWGVS